MRRKNGARRTIKSASGFLNRKLKNEAKSVRLAVLKVRSSQHRYQSLSNPEL